MASKNRKNTTTSNKRATIVTRTDRTGKRRTETQGRDNGSFDVAISTNERNNSTKLYIDLKGREEFDGSIVLNGRQASTLYRALKRHYETQKS